MHWRWFIAFILLQLLSERNVPAIQSEGVDIPSPRVEFRANPKEMITRRSIDDSTLKLVNDAGGAQGAGRTLNPRLMLSGPNALMLTVLDDKTLRPIADGVVHADIVVQAGARGGNAFVAIGRLESKRTGAAGTCRYEGLGWLDVRLEVHAKGYLPQYQRVGIPGAGGSAIVRLVPGATVKGRFVDDATGIPAENIRIEIFRNGNNSAYHDDSNEAGEFAIDGLPAGRYRVTFPALENQFQLENEHAHFHARVAGAKDGQLDPDAYQDALAEALAESHWLVPQPGTIDIQGSGESDLGTIRLQKTPVLDLQVTYEGAAPLSTFPFEVKYYKGVRDAGGTGFKTDGDGRARLALAGWRPGMTVAVYLPALGAGTYQPKRLFGRLADPQATLSEEDWYKLLLGFGYTANTLAGVPPSSEMDPGILDANVDPSLMAPSLVPTPTYDALTSDQRAAFHLHFEKNRQEYEAFRLRRIALPDHPNYAFFTPAPGEVHPLKMSYKPTAGEMDLILNVRDKASGAPLARFTGVFCERADFLDSALGGNNTTMDLMLSSSSGDRRTFRAIDATGQILLPALKFSEDFLKNEKAVKENRSVPNGPPPEALKKITTPGILVDAPGYVRQLFTFSADELRAAKELTLELEPAATVRGRVVLAGSGEPLTSATLREVLRRAGRWSDAMERLGDPSALQATVGFDQEASQDRSAAKPGAEPVKQDPNYPRKLRVSIGAGGLFELDGLRTNAPWTLRVETSALPQLKRDGITLRPGLNDLGVIEVGTAGWLSGRITDERGAPIRGVAIEFPTAHILRENRQTTTTGPAGDYRVGLLPLKEDRQLVRLVPPWGADTPSTATPGLRSSIAWDGLKTLDRCASNSLSAALPPRRAPTDRDPAHSPARRPGTRPRRSEQLPTRRAGAGWQKGAALVRRARSRGAGPGAGAGRIGIQPACLDPGRTAPHDRDVRARAGSRAAGASRRRRRGDAAGRQRGALRRRGRTGAAGLRRDWYESHQRDADAAPEPGQRGAGAGGPLRRRDAGQSAGSVCVLRPRGGALVAHGGIRLARGPAHLVRSNQRPRGLLRAAAGLPDRFQAPRRERPMGWLPPRAAARRPARPLPPARLLRFRKTKILAPAPGLRNQDRSARPRGNGAGEDSVKSVNPLLGTVGMARSELSGNWPGEKIAGGEYSNDRTHK